MNENGSALIQALVAMGIAAIMSGVFATQFSQMGKQQLLMAQKLEIADVKMSLVSIVGNPDVCSWQLNGIEIASDKSSSFFELLELRAGLNVNSPLIASKGKNLPGSNTGLKVARIYVSELSQISNADFLGRLSLSFDDSEHFIPINPPSVHVKMTLDSKNRIISCLGASGWTSVGSQKSENDNVDGRTLAKFGNCDKADMPSIPNTYNSSGLSQSGLVKAKTEMCDSLPYPISEDGVINYDSDSCPDNWKAKSIFRDDSLAQDQVQRNYMYYPCQAYNSSTVRYGGTKPKSPLLAGLKSKEECYALPSSPQGSTLMQVVAGNNTAFSYAPTSEKSAFVCVSGRWIEN